MKTFRCEELGGLTDEGTAGIGLTRFPTFALSLEADRKRRLLSRERVGLGLVRFVLFRFTVLEVDRLGGFTERPRVMARQMPVPGSQRKPSPCP